MLWFTKLRTTYEFLWEIYYLCKSQFLEIAAFFFSQHTYRGQKHVSQAINNSIKSSDSVVK